MEQQQKKTPRDRALDLIALLVPAWRPNTSQVLWMIRIAIIAAFVLFALLLALDSIGRLFGIRPWTLLSVLAVPLTIGGAVPLINWLQKQRDLEREKQSAQDEALQAYLDQFSQLLTDKDQPLHTTQPGDRLSIIARARTLATLARLEGDRKRTVLQFLYEANLITKDNPVLSLQGCALNKATLRGLNLSRADLRAASLKESDLRFAHLEQADLRNADLTQTDLRYAHLEQADLRGAYLWEADLREASLSLSDLQGALLGQPDGTEVWAIDLETAQRKPLGGATMPDGRKFADWLKDRESSEYDGKNSSPS